MTYRIAIVDDHPLVREALIDIFSDNASFEIIGQGGSADEAVAIVGAHLPDAILLDVNMPGGGVAAAGRIRLETPVVRIIMFSFRQDKEIVRDCFAAGASGYVVKGVSGPELVAAVESVLGGSTYVDPRLPISAVDVASPPAG